MKAQIYFNLHKKTWSMKTQQLNAQGKKVWRVTEYSDSVLFRPEKYVSREGTRQRIIARKQKEICAFVQGEIIQLDAAKPSQLGDTISYNPYFENFFYSDHDKKEIDPKKYSLLYFDKNNKKAHEVLV